jgi:uncharacterized protein (DUF2384 family)
MTAKTAAEKTQDGFPESAGAAIVMDAASAKTGVSAARDMTAGLIMTMIVSQSLGDRILIDNAVRDGLKMKIALELDRNGDVNMESVTRHNIIPRKTWDSALKSGADTLTPVNSERLLRVARVTAKAGETFGRERPISGWSAPRPHSVASRPWPCLPLKPGQGPSSCCSPALITVSPLDPVAWVTPRLRGFAGQGWFVRLRPLALERPSDHLHRRAFGSCAA